MKVYVVAYERQDESGGIMDIFYSEKDAKKAKRKYEIEDDEEDVYDYTYTITEYTVKGKMVD